VICEEEDFPFKSLMCTSYKIEEVVFTRDLLLAYGEKWSGPSSNEIEKFLTEVVEVFHYSPDLGI
jgi:hypothetical protein